MRIADLSDATLAKIRARKFDQILEKHEGPERWEAELEHGEVEFMEISGRWVLLPVPQEWHEKIRIVRVVVSEEGDTLIIFLRNGWYSEAYDRIPFTPETEHYEGFAAICERVPGEEFFIADFYHEWWAVHNDVAG